MPDGLVRRDTAVLPGARKGRGAVANPTARFEAAAREAFDDGWGSLADLADLPPLPTTLLKGGARGAMAWNNSPDLGFDRSINPYRGCEHACIFMAGQSKRRSHRLHPCGNDPFPAVDPGHPVSISWGSSAWPDLSNPGQVPPS